MNRQATWARTGTDVTGLSSMEEVLAKAKLDYEVEKVPLRLPSGVIVPDKYATVKKGTDDVFGIVGNGYEICQNSEAFDFVNYIEEDIKFVKAGETRTGIVYIIAALPDQYVLQDQLTPYVIFQNGHNGMISVKAAISPLRIVCQNQFNVAFKNSESYVSIRHASTLDARLTTARNVLKTSANYMNRFAEEAEELALVNIRNKAGEIIDSFYDIKPDSTERFAEKMEEKRYELLKTYNNEDNQNFKGTAWGLINAYSDVITHEEPGRMTDGWEESKFMKVTFDPRIMSQFINHVKKYV